MKKRDVVKSNILFNEIINKGIRNSNKYFVLCSDIKEKALNNFGIAVGKKVGNAVTRNKVKRQIRNIIDKNINIFPNYHNYIIISKKEVLNLSFENMEKELLKLIKKENTNEKQNNDNNTYNGGSIN